MDKSRPDRPADALQAAARLEAALETIAAASPQWRLKPGAAAVLGGAVQSDPAVAEAIAVLLRRYSDASRRTSIEMNLLSDQVQGLIDRLRRR